MKQWLTASLLVLAASASLPAQEATFEKNVQVRGEVTTDDGPVYRNDLTVELVGPGMSGTLRTGIDSNGGFELWNVAPGQYEVRVTDLYGNVLAREYTSIGDTMPVLSIRLPAEKAERPGGVVSVSRLRHKPPRQALKSIERSQKADAKGDPEKALLELEKAVAADPEFVEARNNLGVRYVQRNQLEKALEQFQAAVKADPRFVPAQSNLALALVALDRNAEAELAARRTIDLDGTSANARYMLAVALLRQGKSPAEAMGYLMQAARQLPQARLTAAALYANWGKPEEARGQVQAYLSEAQSPDREKAAAILAHLDKAERGSELSAGGDQ